MRLGFVGAAGQHTGQQIGATSQPSNLMGPSLASRMKPMTERKPVECWLTDMDGVLVHEEQGLPGGADFIAALRQYTADIWC